MHVSKRNLLLDMRILYRNLKGEHPRRHINFSKDAELRPKWCVLPGPRGAHSVCVCVCVIHKNLKAS